MKNIGRNFFRIWTLLLPACGATAAFGEECYRADSLDWTLSSLQFVVWADEAESRIVLFDNLEDRSLDLEIQRDSKTGRPSIQPDFEKDRRSTLQGRLTYGLKRANGGFMRIGLQGGVPSTIYWYDSNLQARGTTSLMDEIGSRGELIEDNRILGLFQWLVAGDQLFAFGSLGVEGSLDEYTVGFFASELKTLHGSNIVPKAELVMNFPEISYYGMTTYPYLAADGDIAYFLAMGALLELYSYDTRSGDLVQLAGFPQSPLDTVLPDLPLGPVHIRYAEVEHLRLPVGLYAEGGLLYVLYREPAEELGVSRWTLYQFEPKPAQGKVSYLGAAHLPTQDATRHVVLLPGEGSWMLFELGAVQQDKKRAPLAVVDLPFSWIRNPNASPLASDSDVDKAQLCLPN